MKLTEKEKEVILRLRQKEDLKLPKKIGFLKEDLYAVKDRYYETYSYYFSPAEMDREIESFRAEFELACVEGTRFDCYFDENGVESWCDSVNYGIEGLGADWARKYLINIESVKKK